MRETEDGFRIAEEDLKLRGAGEILGTRQSGLPTFRLADLAAHSDLLTVARDDARLIMRNDPDLKGERERAFCSTCSKGMRRSATCVAASFLC